MSKEAIYDEQVAPLMTQIIAICKEHKISLIADYGLDDDTHCTTALLTDDYAPSDSQLQALELLRPRRVEAFAITITRTV